jgi:predicted secreted protein
MSKTTLSSLAAVAALLASAIGAFRERAARIAEAFRARGWRVRDVSLNTEGGVPPVPRLMMAARTAMADEAATPPSLEGGTSRVVVAVSGTV